MLSKAILNQIGIAFEKAKSKTKIKKQTNEKKNEKEKPKQNDTKQKLGQ